MPDSRNTDTGSTTPGPEPERLKLDRDDWRDAVREALEGERPADDVEEEEEGDDATE